MAKNWAEILPKVADTINEGINEGEDPKHAFALVVFENKSPTVREAHMCGNAAAPDLIRALMEYCIAKNQEMQ